MKSQEIVKKVISNEYDEEFNHARILAKIEKKRRNKKYKFILVPTCLALIISIVYMQTNGTENVGVKSQILLKRVEFPKEKDKPDIIDTTYFDGTITANKTEASLDSEVKITWDTDSENNIGYHFPYYLNNTTETYTDYKGNVLRNNRVYSLGYKMDINIQGENIEKVIYTLNDSKGNAKIYRAVSGELNPINPYDIKEEYYTSKLFEDYSMEDRQCYLDSIGYTEKKATALTLEEFIELANSIPRIDMPQAPEGATEEEDKRFYDGTWEYMFWDIIERSTSIQVPKDEQSEKYTLFITKILENMDYLTSVEQFYELASEQSVLSNKGLAKAISEETTLTIQIVYKNGTIHEKTVTFNVVEVVKSYEYDTGETVEYTVPVLEATIK
ncbi:MAG: hypothetical protein ACK5LC_12570 [Coprobacillaceae bacterium]